LRVGGQPGLHSKTLSHIHTQKGKKIGMYTIDIKAPVYKDISKGCFLIHYLN
jgi:hypothetical protein